MYLSPLSSCYQQTSRSHVFSSFPDPTIHPIASVKPHRLLLAKPQSFPNSKTPTTLWKGVGCVYVQISSQGMTMGEGRRRGYNDFSLRMNSSLSKRWVCCVVQNLSWVFLFEWPLLFLWVMRIYIVWVKGKKVTLKIPQAECFTGTSLDGLSCEALAKCNLALDSSAFSMCFSHGFFRRNFTRELLVS